VRGIGLINNYDLGHSKAQRIFPMYLNVAHCIPKYAWLIFISNTFLIEKDIWSKGSLVYVACCMHVPMFSRSSLKEVKHFLVAIFSSKSTFVGSKCHLGVWWAALRCLMGDELTQQTS
jgi:hypothetical protein